MKKRYFGLLLLGMLISIFITGCKGIEETGNEETKNEGTENVETENEETENKETQTENRNPEYYYYSNGSSSLFEEFMIYRYDDQYIFVADYFNCGQGLMETHALTEEQAESFLEEINSVSFDEAVPDAKDTDGESKTNGVMLVDNTDYSVGKINFEAIGLEIKDAGDVEYPSEALENSFEINGFEELQESLQWKNNMLSNGIQTFGQVIKEQAEMELEAPIDSMVIDELGTEDLTIKLHTKEDEWYIATVTYRGYVAEIEKE